MVYTPVQGAATAAQPTNNVYDLALLMAQANGTNAIQPIAPAAVAQHFGPPPSPPATTFSGSGVWASQVPQQVLPANPDASIPLIQGAQTVSANPASSAGIAQSVPQNPANPVPAGLATLSAALGSNYPLGNMTEDQWASLAPMLLPNGTFNAANNSAWTPQIATAFKNTLSTKGFSADLAKQIAESSQLSDVMKLRLSVDLHNNRITPAQALEIAYFYLRADHPVPTTANEQAIKQYQQEEQQRNIIANQISQYALSLPTLNLTLPGGLNLTDFFKSPTLPDWSSNLGFALDSTGTGYTQNITSVPKNSNSKVSQYADSTNPLAKRLAAEGRSVANGRTGSSGHCYSQVDGATKAMDNAGLGKYLQGDYAQDAAEGPPGTTGLGLKNDPRFTEVTGTDTLKEGDVIVYKGNPATGHKAGHIEIAQGSNGKATSDYIGDVNSGTNYSGIRIFRLKDGAVV